MVIFHSFLYVYQRVIVECLMVLNHNPEVHPVPVSLSFTVGSVDVWQHAEGTHGNNEFYPRIGWRLNWDWKKTGFAARIFPWMHINFINCKPTINCMALKAWSLHLWTENHPQDFAFDMRDWPFEELEDLLRLSEEAGVGHQIGWSLRRPHSEGLSSFSLRTALFFGWVVYKSHVSTPEKGGAPPKLDVPS